VWAFLIIQTYSGNPNYGNILESNMPGIDLIASEIKAAPGLCIPDLIKAQVKKAPEAAATPPKVQF